MISARGDVVAIWNLRVLFFNVFAFKFIEFSVVFCTMNYSVFELFNTIAPHSVINCDSCRFSCECIMLVLTPTVLLSLLPRLSNITFTAFNVSNLVNIAH